MPKPLFTKLVAQGAIGFFCVLFGCTYGLHSHDRILLFLSLLIGIGSLIRSIHLYRIIHNKSYFQLEGTCIKREATLFKQNLQVSFTDSEGKEYRFTLDKGVKLLQGHYYRLYFKITKESDISFADFLGFEELTSFK